MSNVAFIGAKVWDYGPKTIKIRNFALRGNTLAHFFTNS